jgi:hypothetical protein
MTHTIVVTASAERLGPMRSRGLRANAAQATAGSRPHACPRRVYIQTTSNLVACWPRRSQSLLSGIYGPSDLGTATRSSAVGLARCWARGPGFFGPAASAGVQEALRRKAAAEHRDLPGAPSPKRSSLGLRQWVSVPRGGPLRGGVCDVTGASSSPALSHWQRRSCSVTFDADMLREHP